MSMPAVQKPHWTAPCSMNASWSGSSVSPSPSPSTVRTRVPSASTARWVQELTGAPSTSTVQAPQTCMSQERLAPLRPSRSRSTSKSSACAGTSRATARPLTVKARLHDDGVRVSLMKVSPGRPRGHGGDSAAHEHPRHLALVVGGAVEIGDGVHRLGRLIRERLRGVGEVCGRGADHQLFDVGESPRPRANAAHGQPGLRDRPGGTQRHGQGHAKGGTLVDAELEIDSDGPLGPGTQAHRRQDLVVPARRLIRAEDEIGERDLALPSSAPERDGAVEGETDRGQIAVRIREGEITADGADVTHAHVGHVRGHASQERAPLAEERRLLHDPMAHRGADRHCAVLRDDLAEAFHTLDVDEAVHAQEPFLQQEEELRAPGIEGGVASVLREEIAQLRQRGRPVEREGAEHAQPAAARWKRAPNSSTASSALRWMTPWPRAPSLPSTRPSASTWSTLVSPRASMSRVTCMEISAPITGSRPRACSARRRSGSASVTVTSSGTDRLIGPTFWLIWAA